MREVNTILVDVLGEVVRREKLSDQAEKFSGAAIERVATADGDFIVKILPPQGDWITRGTDGMGRIRQLWDDGVFERLAPHVHHTMIAVAPSTSGDVMVMRDVRAALLRPGPIRPASAERVLAGLAAMHGAFEGFAGSYCSVGARLGLFAPQLHAEDEGPNPHPARDLIVDGWALFPELVPADSAQAVTEVHRLPHRLAHRIAASAPSTLLHGDAKPENLGAAGDRLVAIDWGELTGSGPAETDLAWFAMQAAWRLDVSPADIFDGYEAHATRPCDPTALDLACIGAMAQMGFKLAFRTLRAGDEAVRARATTLLSWWTTRVADALIRTGGP